MRRLGYGMLHVDFQQLKNCDSGAVCTPIAWHLQGHYGAWDNRENQDDGEFGIPISCYLNSPAGEAYRNAVQVESAMRTSL